MRTKPLLFLDVDGVLNPDSRSSGHRPPGYETHRMRPSGFDHPRQKPLRVWLNPAHGEWLKSLPVELVWATTWEDEANEWIGPHLGLPNLPVVHFTRKLQPRVNLVYFKTADLVAYAAGHPFAWLDDEIMRADGDYVTRHHHGASLLVQVSPFVGLTEDHVQHLRVWLAGL